MNTYTVVKDGQQFKITAAEVMEYGTGRDREVRFLDAKGQKTASFTGDVSWFIVNESDSGSDNPYSGRVVRG